MTLALLLYLATGAVAGFLAGLLGVGGGLIIVPALIFIFSRAGFAPDYVAHMALGTSLGSIVFTSIASLRAHHRRRAVNWPVVRALAPGIVVGTLAGALLATVLSSKFLQAFFVVFVFYVGTQMLLDLRPPPTRALPGPRGLFAAGGVIGVVSALVGIGGGSLSVPFLTWCDVKLHEAIGTSAALGLPIALAGLIGFALTGWFVSAPLPVGSLGFIYMPALLGLIAASVMTAPLGARAAHALPVARLKRLFALVLYLIGVRMAWGLFG